MAKKPEIKLNRLDYSKLMLRVVRNLGRSGIAAISAIDAAFWDLMFEVA